MIQKQGNTMKDIDYVRVRNGFTRLDNAVWDVCRDHELSTGETACLILIRSFDYHGTGCHPSHVLLSKYLRKNRKTIIRYTNALEGKDLINITRSHGRSNHYDLSPLYEKIARLNNNKITKKSSHGKKSGQRAAGTSVSSTWDKKVPKPGTPVTHKEDKEKERFTGGNPPSNEKETRVPVADDKISSLAQEQESSAAAGTKMSQNDPHTERLRVLDDYIKKGVIRPDDN